MIIINKVIINKINNKQINIGVPLLGLVKSIYYSSDSNSSRTLKVLPLRPSARFLSVFFNAQGRN